MKTLRFFLLFAVAAIFIFAVFGLLKVVPTEQEAQQEYVVADFVSDLIAQAPVVQDTAALDSVLPQAMLPVLNIGGKENADVYLQSLDIQVEVTGNIASTRYTMVFKNRTMRALEGELTFPLPDGRTVTHYALDIEGKMRDAVPVEKAKATQVFEEIQQRQVDPGVLERVEGNNFRTRIYPFPANGTRTISVGYEEELALERGLLYYRLPMAYSNSLEKFTLKATVLKSEQKPLVPKSNDEIRFDAAGENYVASFARENYKPARSLIFALPSPADIPQVMLQPAQGSHYFLASVAPRMATYPKQWSDDLAIIWDVSLSASKRNLQKEIEMLDMLFAENKNANIHLYFLNNKLVKVESGNWDKLKSILGRAIFDGGTDFSQINLDNVLGKEILFFSDGISTLGDADFLKNAKRPVHSIVSSSEADYSAMRMVAGKTNGKFINLNALSPEQLKDELQNETLQFLGTQHGKEIREVYPSIAMPVQGNFSVAGILEKNDAELTLLFGFGNKIAKRITVKLEAKNSGTSAGSTPDNIYRIWAQKKIAELDLNYDKNRNELTKLGKQFGIVTRNTSLIVLETIADYVQYDIEPPASETELRHLYNLSQKINEADFRRAEQDMLESAVSAAKTLKKWWDKDFYKEEIEEFESEDLSPNKKREETKNTKKQEKPRKKMGAGGKPRGRGQVRPDGKSVQFAEEEDYENFRSQPTITIKLAKKDVDYLNKLTGRTDEDYKIYLETRNDYANLPTFYFDMANWFYELGDKERAVRILTSIAELELENASLYRLLGYRLKEYGEFALQKFVCQKVIQWRPMEPQSYRDYALALADNGEMQAALDSLYGLLTKPYAANINRRSRGIEEIVVTEINRIIALKPKRLDISKIDKRLIIKIPVDIRVVINWNMNNTDIDLHVTDPMGTESSYRTRETNIGGRISNDNTSGYGPEQFMLKKAMKGKYQIYVNYYGSREFAAAGPSTVMAEIFTKYAGKAEQRKVVSLQLSNVKKRDGKGKVEVAEFQF